MNEKEQVEKFLEEERKKLDKAKEISEELGEWKWWKTFSPKYRRLLKEYKKVIDSFEILNNGLPPLDN